MLQMQIPPGLPQLQVPHLEPRRQLLTWKGCSQQPHLPHKLPLRGLPHRCGRPQAQLKAGVAWAVPKQAWGCKEASHSLVWGCNLVWGFSLVLQWGTWLVSFVSFLPEIRPCNVGVMPAMAAKKRHAGQIGSRTQILCTLHANPDCSAHSQTRLQSCPGGVKSMCNILDKGWLDLSGWI